MSTPVPTTLPQLRDAIASGTAPSSSPASILAILDLARRVLGDAFDSDTLLVTEAALSDVLPEEPDEDLAAAFADRTLYLRCRESILKHCKLAGLWPDDPYPLLNRIGQEIGAPWLNQRAMHDHFPDRLPGEVTREDAIRADLPLRGTERRALRSNLEVLDRLRSDPRIRDIGLLGPEAIGPLPLYRDGDRLPVELPADLADVLPRLSKHDASRARRAYELAMDLGVLSEDSCGRLRILSEPEARRYFADISARVSRTWAGLCLRALIALLRAASPASVPEDLTVDRVRRPDGPRTSAAAKKPPVQKTDRTQVKLPDPIEAEIADYAATRPISRKQLTNLRAILTKLFDGRREEDPSQVLAGALLRLDVLYPNATEGTRRVYTSILRGYLRHSTRLAPWDQLLDHSKQSGSADFDARGLRCLRHLARERGLAPADIDIDSAASLAKEARRRKMSHALRQGLRSLDLLRETAPHLLPPSPIGALPDARKRDNIDLPARLEQALQQDAKNAGYAGQGTKAQLVAVRKLYSLSSARERFEADLAEIPWVALIDEALASHPEAMAPYRAELTRLAARLTRPLSTGWRDLETVISAAGVTRLDNPVAALATVAGTDGLEPWQLDREWAWTHERGLRPDLRLTWARNIGRLDALHDLPMVAASGLLPAERLGPMPPRGSRLKQAVLPMPPLVERALEGEAKQLLEAAHFTWRCLRELGVYRRGDDPAPRELVAERHLELIAAEQRVMTPASARLHLARIRDWRESQPGLA